MSKRILEAYKLYNKDNFYSFDEAIDILLKYKEVSSVKFDESVDVVVNLGVDTNKTDQNIKSFVELPNGNGKKVRVLVFANDDNIDKALSIGAVYAGGDELVEKVSRGEVTDFDKCVATTSMMPKLAKIAKILGPRGLMPNPKLGTVVNGDVSAVVSALIKGRSDIKTSKDGSIKVSIGRLTFTKQALIDNLKELISVVKQLKPASVKSNYFRNVFLTSTMGVGIKLKMSDIYSL